jgi:hypothetical protein
MPSVWLDVSAMCASNIQDADSRICFSGPNDMFVSGSVVVAYAGFILLDCAFAKPIMTSSACSNGLDRSAQRAAAIMVEFFPPCTAQIGPTSLAASTDLSFLDWLHQHGSKPRTILEPRLENIVSYEIGTLGSARRAATKDT